MIDPKSLRRGNYILVEKRIFPIHELLSNYAVVELKQSGHLMSSVYPNVSYEAISGIPLSEQEIIRLGLKHNSDKSIFEITKSSNWDDFTVRSYTENVWTLWYGDAPCLDMTIEYVHELQNLYYYFNREELTYKNETVKQ